MTTQLEAAQRGQIENLERQLKEQNDFLEGLSKAAHQVAQVVSVDSAHVYLTFNGSVMVAEPPKGMKLAGGESVRVVTQTMQILDRVEAPELGPVVRISKVLDERHCEIGGGAEGSRLVLLGRHRPEEGARVLLDRSGQVVVRVLPEEKTAPAIVERVTWDDVGGCEEAKRELVDAIETPYRHRELYARYGQRAAKGVLLHGPTGVGKTMLGKAVASSIADTHGGEGADTGFIYVKGPELLSKWVGSSEGNVRQLFDQARAHKHRHGYPAVVFVDEAEALLASRGGEGHYAAGYMSGTVVPAFLAEMDGLGDSGAFVLLATNLPRLIDVAVLRDGRIDRKVRVERPDSRVARDIFRLHLRGRPGRQDELAEEGARALFDERRVLCEVETAAGVRSLSLAQAASGAMIEGIVARATQVAIRREIDGCAKSERGLQAKDVVGAVDQVEKEQAEQDQRSIIAELVDLEGVRAVRRARRRDATAAA